MWWKGTPWNCASGSASRVVADDGDDVAGELAGVPAIEQVGQAVVVLADEERQARAARRALEAHLHGEARGDVGEGGVEAVATVERQREAVELPLDAHEEELELGVLVLVGVHDVGAVAVEELGDGGDDAALVGAVDEQRRRVTHAGVALQFLPAGVEPIDLGAGGVERGDERRHLGGARLVDRRVFELRLQRRRLRLGGRDRRFDALQLLLLLEGQLARRRLRRRLRRAARRSCAAFDCGVAAAAAAAAPGGARATTTSRPRRR